MCCDSGAVECFDDCVLLPGVFGQCVLWVKRGVNVVAACAVVATGTEDESGNGGNENLCSIFQGDLQAAKRSDLFPEDLIRGVHGVPQEMPAPLPQQLDSQRQCVVLLIDLNHCSEMVLLRDVIIYNSALLFLLFYLTVPSSCYSI